VGIADTTNQEFTFTVDTDIDQSTAVAVGDATGGDLTQEGVTQVSLGQITGGELDFQVLEPGAVSESIELSGEAVLAATSAAGTAAGVASEAVQSAFDLAGKKIETGGQTATRLILWIFGILTVMLLVNKFAFRSKSKGITT